MLNSFDKNSDLFSAVQYATRFARLGESLQGRRLFPTLEIVTKNEDPEFRRRIKVADSSMGGKVESSWLQPIRVTENSDPPLPKINQTVLVFYVDGDSEKGFYLPTILDTNPSREKQSPVNDHSEKIDGNREVVVGGDETLTTEGNQDIYIGNQQKLAVAGDIETKSEADMMTRANGSIDINCGSSLILRTDSGASITLTGQGFVIIQDAFGRKITLGGIGNNGQWDLAGSSLNIVSASDVTINGKSIVVLGGKDSRNDTIVSKGY